MYSFMYVFINYLFLLISSYIIYIFLQDGGPFKIISKLIDIENHNAFKMTSILLFSIITSVILYNMLLLKTFIWNMYQTILLSVAMTVSLEEENRKKQTM